MCKIPIGTGGGRGGEEEEKDEEERNLSVALMYH